MQAIEDWATKHQIDAIPLDMLAVNTEARRFYERLGCTEFGTLMLKTLNSR